MRNIQTALNNDQHKRFLRQCRELRESEYAFVKKAVIERMANNESLMKKIDKWLFETDHKI